MLIENLIRFKFDFFFFFVSFPYKLNCLDFCYYFFSELMSIFFILIVGAKTQICTLGLKPYLLMGMRPRRSK